MGQSDEEMWGILLKTSSASHMYYKSEDRFPISAGDSEGDIMVS